MKYIAMTIAFIVTLNLGTFLNEKLQENLAQQFGYESHYNSILRFYIFTNPEYQEVIFSEKI